MVFRPFDVSAAHLVYTILGAFVVIFGMLSTFVKEKLYLGEAPIATVIGIILGPNVLKLFNPDRWGSGSQGTLDEVTLEVTRVIIAIGVFAIGVELPKAYMKKHWRTIFFLLGPCMVYGWLVSALLIWGLIPGLTYLSSLVIAACVTPTDPILAQAVVGGKFADKHVPTHIRHLLSAESGCNDGAAFPFLYIALYLTLDRSPGHAVGEWFYVTWVYEVLLGIVIGTLLGWSARKVMQWAEKHNMIDRQSFVAQYVSLAVLSIGICTLLGSDDLLAAFACGSAFAWDGHFNKATEDAVFSNVIDLLFNCAAFIYIGAWIPFKSYGDASIHLSVWRLIVLAICILILRRLPIIMLLYRWIPDLKTAREAAFVGWFGPMGVGAVFIATLARHHIPHPEPDGDTSQVDLLQETIIPIVSMLVLASILTHGLSIPFFLSGRRVHSITYTWSRNPSMDTRSGNEPAWTTHTRRVQPGQQVEINRDDEEGDIGMVQRNPLSMHRTKSILIDDGSGSNGSGSSKTRGAENLAEKEEEDEEREEVNRGMTTPPLAGFREGHDLIIERRDPDREVDVQVIKDAFREDKKKAYTYQTPEGEKIAFNGQEIPVRGSRRTTEPEETQHAPAEEDEEPVRRRPETPDSQRSYAGSEGSEHSTNAGSDSEEVGDGFMRRRPYQNARSSSPPPRVRTDASTSSMAPGVHSYIPASRLGKRPEKEGGGWRRFLRVATTSSNASSHEEGRSAGSEEPSTGFRRNATNRSMLRAPTIEVTHDGGDNDRGLHLTRTLSRAVSFAPDVAPSSDTVPSVSNYGSANPTFKRTPGLSMFRTSSIQNDNDDGPSVTFKE